MPRQNFLSRESFVDATENRTREAILSIPESLSSIRYLGENKLNESIKFSYHSQLKDMEYHIHVIILPLNEKFTRISLHASHVNGHVFHSDADMTVALHDFEAVIQAALKGELMYYKPYEPRVSQTKKLVRRIASLKVPGSVLSFRKKLLGQ